MNILTVSRSRRQNLVAEFFGAPAFVTALAAHVRTSRRIRRDIAHLDALSDHHLQDIGIMRDEIPAAVRHGRD
jgi:uncharacterized protein YjiS (DUF1127 family)